jgi:hypothetical protein
MILFTKYQLQRQSKKNYQQISGQIDDEGNKLTTNPEK